MRRLLHALLMVSLAAAPAAAQQTVVTYVDANGNRVAVTPNTPLPTSAAAPSGATSNQVQGTAPNGSPPVANPQLVAGSDGTNTRTISTTTSGIIKTTQGSSLADGVTLPFGNGVLDVGGANRPLGTAGMTWTGTAFTYQRDANTAAGTTGTGLLGVGNLGFDGTNWRALSTDSLGRLTGFPTGAPGAIHGNIASGSTDASNPVKIGGFASANAPTAVTAGQRVNAWYTLNGAANVAMTGGAVQDGATLGLGAGVFDPSNSTNRPLSTVTMLSNGGTAMVYQRDAVTTSGTTGTGLLGAGILGRYSATLPTYTDGQFGTLAMNARGVLTTTNLPTPFALADGAGNNVNTIGGPNSEALQLPVRPSLFNGSTWDRNRAVNGSDGTGLGVTAVAETPNSAAGAAIVPATALGATTLVGKAAPGNLYGATVTASGSQTGTGYFIVANLTAAPASGTALTAAQVLYCVAVAPGATVSMGGNGVPDRGTVGLTALYSTACNTYTPQGTAPLHMRVRVQ